MSGGIPTTTTTNPLLTETKQNKQKAHGEMFPKEKILEAKSCQHACPKLRLLQKSEKKLSVRKQPEVNDLANFTEHMKL